MAIKIQDVSYNYGHEDVIKKINLDFVPGQLVSLVGPNGAGKTTLLKLNFWGVRTSFRTDSYIRPVE